MREKERTWGEEGDGRNEQNAGVMKTTSMYPIYLILEVVLEIQFSYKVQYTNVEGGIGRNTMEFCGIFCCFSGTYVTFS